MEPLVKFGGTWENGVKGPWRDQGSYGSPRQAKDTWLYLVKLGQMYLYAIAITTNKGCVKKQAFNLANEIKCCWSPTWFSCWAPAWRIDMAAD